MSGALRHAVKEGGKMQAVHQRVVCGQIHRQQHPVPLLREFAEGDAGIAVRRSGRRQGNGRERQPRQARDEEQLVRVGSVVQRGRGLDARDLGLRGRKKRAERLRAVECAVAVGPVRGYD